MELQWCCCQAAGRMVLSLCSVIALHSCAMLSQTARTRRTLWGLNGPNQHHPVLQLVLEPELNSAWGTGSLPKLCLGSAGPQLSHSWYWLQPQTWSSMAVNSSSAPFPKVSENRETSSLYLIAAALSAINLDFFFSSWLLEVHRNDINISNQKQHKDTSAAFKNQHFERYIM